MMVMSVVESFLGTVRVPMTSTQVTITSYSETNDINIASIQGGATGV